MTTFTHEYDIRTTISLESTEADPNHAVEQLIVSSYSTENAVKNLMGKTPLLSLLKDLDHVHTKQHADVCPATSN